MLRTTFRSKNKTKIGIFPSAQNGWFLRIKTYFCLTLLRCLFSMKLTKYVVIAGALCLNSVTSPMVWAQPTHRLSPAEGTAYVEGSVRDANTKQPIAGASVTAKSKEGIIRAQQRTGVDGSFQLKLDPKLPYILSIQANGYDPFEEALTFTSGLANRLQKPPTLLYPAGTKPGSTPIAASAATAAPVVQSPASSGNPPAADNGRVIPPKTLDAKVTYVPPLIVAPTGKTTQLQAVQFVQSKAELLPEAIPALEQLLAFMNGKPTAEIELSGHTDNQGDFDKNLKLSKERVDVVKAYLVEHGIAANRITTRGYGPTRPIASNNAEDTRKLNRRVEMIVVRQ